MCRSMSSTPRTVPSETSKYGHLSVSAVRYGLRVPGARRGSLLLLDSASLYFRAFFGVPDTMRAPDGTPVNAVRGFLDMIAFLVTSRQASRVVACWDDDWRPAFRVAAIPSYKAHRLRDPVTGTEETPAALDPQVPVIVDVLAAFGIARVGAPGFEADDVIATLATRASAGPRATEPDGTGGVEVVTGDRDLFQVVDDARGVCVLYVARGVRNLEVVQESWLRAKYGVDGGAGYADLAALRGDPSDGLPGVAGIGEKTAAGLLATYGSLDAVLAAADAADPRIGPATRRRLAQARDYLAVAPSVVGVVRDAPVAVVDDRLPQTPADPERLVDLVARFNLASSVERVLRAMAAHGRPE